MKSALTAVIVDDEPLARDELSYLLKNIGVEVAGQGKNGLEAVSLIKELEPDVVFLDVQMPGLDGLGVVRRLIDKKIALPHIIFATAYDQYAVRAFDLEAVDYILKPFDKARLARSIDRVQKLVNSHQPQAPEKMETLLETMQSPRPQQRPAKIILRAQNRMLMVDAEDVVYATIEDGVITVVTRDMEGMSNYGTIDELEAALPESFWRAHRSFLVNINRIREVVPWFKSQFMLRMDDKKQSQVPVSRKQTQRLRELFKL